MLSAREQIVKELDELVPEYVGADYLRGVERILEGVVSECGPHPLVIAAIKKISARIIFLEIGKKGETHNV
jgi:hypothetical protein